MKIIDESGFESDSVEIVLADHIPLNRINLPKVGAEIKINLGYDDLKKSKDMGAWFVDEIRISGPPDSMTLIGRASILIDSIGGKLAMTTHRSRTWNAGTTIGGMVKKIAAEHGLEEGVSKTMAVISLPHLLQINESDLNFLTRLANQYGGIATQKKGKLIFISKAESETLVSNKEIPIITIHPEEITSYQTTIKARGLYGSVIAKYRDLQTASDKEVVVGNGEPIFRFQSLFPTHGAAKLAAESKYLDGKRSLQEISLTMPGRTELIAEGRMALDGFRDGLNGLWRMKRVEHSFDSGGYISSVTLAVNVTEEDVPIAEDQDSEGDD
jgi:phage protein D